ncbi:hypothetical protein CH35J_010995 [Colletotrichum higginsianum]|uniref:Uncharacterized protein n=1 Tax=Colletotrichum higginsianum TaxID=80884 RepID=A0A4T0VI73_9PEZI|nr:hypothetical protein CH35J_010995 [Colletotrichum higginsianum]
MSRAAPRTRSAASAVRKERPWEPIGEKFKDEAAKTLALEIAAKAFCRVSIMAATLSLRLIPFLGWVASVALQFAMLALV